MKVQIFRKTRKTGIIFNQDTIARFVLHFYFFAIRFSWNNRSNKWFEHKATIQ